jgi:hypothetical protein
MGVMDTYKRYLYEFHSRFNQRYLNKYKLFKYHQRHIKLAKKALRTLEAQKGQLNPNFIRLSNEYANDVLGWENYAPWLYVYCAVAGCFKEGWIPDNYYGKIVVPKISGDYEEVSGLKPLTNKLFKTTLFPDIAYFINGLWFSKDFEPLPKSHLISILFEESEKVVFKLDNSLRGRGVYIFDENTLDLDKIPFLGNGVFQQYIQQHPFFEEFMPSSVATIRVTSVIDHNGNPAVRACFLRLGRSSDSHVQATSEVDISVNLETGKFQSWGYLANWLPIQKHPDTNVKFENKELPNIKECFSIVTELHKKLPFARAIGWDLIIDKKGDIKIMEWNAGHNDIKFSEATVGPCFADLGWELLWRPSAL